MLFENINYLLAKRGATPLLANEFLGLDPEALWEVVNQLDVPFETLNTIDLKAREEILKSTDIKLVVLDVDGVFTDGGLFYSSAGEEIKKFNVKDGMAITQAIKKGVQFGIISAASRSEVVEIRAKILGIQHVYVGKKPKLEVLESWLYQMGFGFENVAYIGDDVNDLDILRKVGIGACPADAVPAVRKTASVVLHHKGGQGCIREFIEGYVTAII